MKNKMIEWIEEAKAESRADEMAAFIASEISGIDLFDGLNELRRETEYIADHLIANGVTIIPECKGCAYENRKRPQKCSCCRRNKDMADLFKPEPPKGE